MAPVPAGNGAGRRWRVLVTVAGLAALLAGSAWGTDDAFPFGPFRMYANTTRTTGGVVVPQLVGVSAEGRKLPVRAGQLGLRGAEVEGQIPRIRRDPRLLGHLVTAYERTRPDAPRLVELRLEQRRRRLEDGRVQGRGSVVQTLARWRRPSIQKEDAPDRPAAP